MELVYRVDLKYDDSAKVALWNRPQPRIVYALIAHGADVNVTYPEDLQWGKKSTGPGVPLLAVAIERADYATVRELIVHGARVNDPPLSSKNFEYAPMFEAILHGRVEAVKLLVHAGADINVRMSNGQTSLGFARRLATAAPRVLYRKSIVAVLERSGGHL
jgi:ankyrin repeat protein